MPCCGCASTTTAPEVGADGARGRVGARRPIACTRWTVLSDEAVVAARSRLNPAAGVMLVGGVGEPAPANWC